MSSKVLIQKVSFGYNKKCLTFSFAAWLFLLHFCSVPMPIVDLPIPSVSPLPLSFASRTGADWLRGNVDFLNALWQFLSVAVFVPICHLCAVVVVPFPIQLLFQFPTVAVFWRYPRQYDAAQEWLTWPFIKLAFCIKLRTNTFCSFSKTAFFFASLRCSFSAFYNQQQ